MTRGIVQDVSGTAFVVNYSRSKMVEVSKDVYAHLWVTPEAILLWDDMAANVYPNDDINLSVRNRFFLELVQKFINENKDPVFVNIAAGFTNYPFLVEGNCKFVEVDLPNIIAIKGKMVVEFIQAKKLPPRNVEHIAVDLNDANQRIKMKQRLTEIIAGRPSIVVMEGLTYYLSKEVLDDIFVILHDVQKIGSIAAFDHWQPDAMQYPTMVRLKNFLDIRFGGSGQDWHLFGDEYIKKIKGYTKISSTDVAKTELQYSKTRKLQGKDNMVPDFYSVLRKV